MAQLDAGGGTFAMYAVGQSAKSGDNLRAHDQLAVETKSALCNGGVCHGGHSHTATCHTGVVVVELLTGFVPWAHALEGRTTDGAVPEGEGTYLCLFEDFVLHS